METVDKIDITSWIQVASIVVTILLGILAIIGPYLFEYIKYYFYKPHLIFKYQHEEPFAHKTLFKWKSNAIEPGVPFEYQASPSGVYIQNGLPAFYFRFQVVNEGLTVANNCEVQLNELSKREKRRYKKVKNFTPVNLKWSGPDSQKSNINIKPDMRAFCDLGFVKKKDTKFSLAQTFEYYAQESFLLPGKYKIRVIVYSDTLVSNKLDLYLEWSGKWKEGLENMKKEVVITI